MHSSHKWIPISGMPGTSVLRAVDPESRDANDDEDSESSGPFLPWSLPAAGRSVLREGVWEMFPDSVSQPVGTRSEAPGQPMPGMGRQGSLPRHLQGKDFFSSLKIHEKLSWPVWLSGYLQTECWLPECEPCMGPPPTAILLGAHLDTPRATSGGAGPTVVPSPTSPPPRRYCPRVYPFSRHPWGSCLPAEEKKLGAPRVMTPRGRDTLVTRSSNDSAPLRLSDPLICSEGPRRLSRLFITQFHSVYDSPEGHRCIPSFRPSSSTSNRA